MVNSRLWNYYSCWIWHRSLFDYWCSVFYCYDAADQHLALFFIVEVSIGISEWFFSFFSILYGAQNLIFFWRFWILVSCLYLDQNSWMFFGARYWDQNFSKKSLFFQSSSWESEILRWASYGDQNFWITFWTSLWRIRISECFLAFFMEISISECFLDFFLGIRISKCFLDFFLEIRISECFFRLL